jgi:hypothetical protein
MELSDIAAISGKGGLYKVFKPTKAGVILESLDQTKSKIVASATQRLSLLHEISIYSRTTDGATPLETVLRKIHSTFGNDPGLDATADPTELKSFLKSVLPEYDEDRVYVSDIRKLVRWYGILVAYAPEVLVEPAPGEGTK